MTAQTLPLSPIQAALKVRIAASAGSTPVLDRTLDGQAYPYYTLGEDTLSDRSPKAFYLTEVTHTLHCWSQYPGSKQVQDMMDTAIQAVTGSALTVTGYRILRVYPEFAQAMRDADGVTRHGVVRFRFLVEQN